MSDVKEIFIKVINDRKASGITKDRVSDEDLT